MAVPDPAADILSGEEFLEIPFAGGLPPHRFIGDIPALRKDGRGNGGVSDPVRRTESRSVPVEGSVTVESVIVPDHGAAVIGRHQLEECVTLETGMENKTVRLGDIQGMPPRRDCPGRKDDEQQQDCQFVFHVVRVSHTFSIQI